MKPKSADKRKTATSPKAPKVNQNFPAGWNQERVQAVIDYYEKMTDAERAADIEAAREIEGQTLISVPTKLIPAIRKLIAKHQRSA
jgi:hypothetical protein